MSELTDEQCDEIVQRAWSSNDHATPKDRRALREAFALGRATRAGESDAVPDDCTLHHIGGQKYACPTCGFGGRLDAHPNRCLRPDPAPASLPSTYAYINPHWNATPAPARVAAPHPCNSHVTHQVGCDACYWPVPGTPAPASIVAPLDADGALSFVMTPSTGEGHHADPLALTDADRARLHDKHIGTPAPASEVEKWQVTLAHDRAGPFLTTVATPPASDEVRACRHGSMECAICEDAQPESAPK